MWHVKRMYGAETRGNDYALLLLIVDGEDALQYNKLSSKENIISNFLLRPSYY